MKKCILFVVTAFFAVTIKAQNSRQLAQDISNTGILNESLLPLDYSRSFDTYATAKKVLNSKMLVEMETLNDWTHEGIGGMKLTSDRSISGKYSLELSAPVRPTDLGKGGTILNSRANFNVGGQNWGKYNRLHFYVYPHATGSRAIYLNLYLVNDGKIKVPDKYNREGFHEMNLVDGKWNEIFVEMPELPRDKVTQIAFAIEVFGKEQAMLVDTLKFDIDAVSLQNIADPAIASGWQPSVNRIIYSTTGYDLNGQKTAIVNIPGNSGKFQLLSHDNQVVYQGNLENKKTTIGSFQTLDFSGFTTPGEYYLKVDQIKTKPFFISDHIWSDSAWRVLNFIYSERCGYAVPGKHGACHADLHAVYNGKDYPFHGGWHDAGDMSQQVLQSGEIVQSLLEMANTAGQKGEKPLELRLKAEAKYGIDLLLRARLGDGFRAQSWGTNLWTDGFIGTVDDSENREVHVFNRAYENFVLAGIEAYAAMAITDDPALSGKLRQAAMEDYAFAKKKFNEVGYADIDSVPNYGGHASMTSNSQYAANISFAASQLYKLTKDQFYADEASKAIEYTLQTQSLKPIGKDQLSGFFYRDTDMKSIVHFNHQSRDAVFMEALTTLCETQPNNPNYQRWLTSIKRYGDYLKKIMKYVAPYGLVPSGIYGVDEIKDTKNFYKVQPFIKPGSVTERDYDEQLKSGVKIDNKHYLRVFPVWFFFRGNAAVQLSTGKGAAVAGKFLKDKELLNIAEQQLYWIVGKNPFGQSMIWGEGDNYPQLYNALLGETVGEIPVGMKTRANEDVPYWPQWNTATYKEVWGAPAARWLSLISEF